MPNNNILISEPNPLERAKAISVCDNYDFSIFLTEYIQNAKSAIKISNFFSVVIVEVFSPLTKELSEIDNSYLGLILALECLELNIPCLLIYEDKQKKNLSEVKEYVRVMEGIKYYQQKNIPLLSKNEGWEKIISEAIKLIKINKKSRQ